jgi:hypothetical protein
MRWVAWHGTIAVGFTARKFGIESEELHLLFSIALSIHGEDVFLPVHRTNFALTLGDASKEGVV